MKFDLKRKLGKKTVGEHEAIASKPMEEKRMPTDDEKEKISELMIQARAGRIPLIHALLEGGLDINSTDSDNVTALMWASFEGKLNVVEYLIGRGANINHRDNNGWNALFSAASNGNSGVVTVLLEHGIEVVKDADGKRAEDIATDEGHNHIAEMIRDRF